MLWLHQLRHFDFIEKTELAEKILALQPSLKQRALILVLSDLHDPEAISALKLLNGRHEVVSILLRDPAEDGMAGAGYIRARDAESHRINTTNARHQFTDSTELISALQRASIDHFLIQTDVPFLSQLRLFLQSRNLLTR